MGVCNCSMFCCTLLYVHFSIAIILMGKRELIALLNLSSWCLVMVERLFLAVPRGCLQFVIVVFPDHTHLLFLQQQHTSISFTIGHQKALDIFEIVMTDVQILSLTSMICRMRCSRRGIIPLNRVKQLVHSTQGMRGSRKFCRRGVKL